MRGLENLLYEERLKNLFRKEITKREHDVDCWGIR